MFASQGNRCINQALHMLIILSRVFCISFLQHSLPTQQLRDDKVTDVHIAPVGEMAGYTCHRILQIE